LEIDMDGSIDSVPAENSCPGQALAAITKSTGSGEFIILSRGPGRGFLASRRENVYMLGIALLTLLILPFVDFYILVQVAGQIGFWNTLGIVLLTGAAGAEVVRREGRYVLRKIQSSVTAGEMSRNALEIGLLVLGGLLLVIPGLITDGLGFLMIFRPARERIAARISGSGNMHVEVDTFRL
jgi:UPF0716 family protein affecting phage T7 exclusion